MLRFTKLSDKAYAPVKGSQYAAGYDLRRYIYLWNIYLHTIVNNVWGFRIIKVSYINEY